jgi:hypothetical protein
MTDKILFISNHDKLPDEKYGFNHHLYQIDEFIKLGCKVTYVVPSFNHFTKSHRKTDNDLVEINSNFRIKILPTISYDSNLGLRRFCSYFIFSLQVFWYGIKLKNIKVIFLVLPSPFLDLTCVLLKKKLNSKLIVDFRDLWPELFEKYLTGFRKIISWPIVKILYFNRRLVFKNADIITAVSQTYLDIAKKDNKFAQRNVIHLGFDEKSTNFSGELQKRKDNKLNVIYAGSLSYNYDINCLLDVIKKIEADYFDSEIFFHIAGSGVFENQFKELEQLYRHRIRFYGNLDKENLYSLYRDVDVSLCIYDKNTLISFPAKLFELIYHHLPIVNSLKGEVEKLVSLKEIGVNYEAGNSESLLNAILHLHINKDELKQIKLNMSLIKKEYSSDVQYSKFYKLIKKVNIK